MVADIARVTYDPTRQYRTLICQQGRVTLEADNNEAAMLASEALRLQTLDVIGPSGALGGGFQVSASGEGFSIGPGTFYLGGWRLALAADVALPKLGSALTDIPNQVIALLLTEQSVGATEDQALREVALGGPDSAARTRLMQGFLPIPVSGESCAGGWADILRHLKDEGISLDAGLQLHSTARLQAGFTPGPMPKDPCTPAAAGGYLGADNQMVRVTVTGFTPGSGGTGSSGTLLWGWNNAALLYRARAVNPTTLTLTTLPVDQEHAPQAGQWVEVLLAALDFKDGNYVAAGQGFVTYVTSGYVAAGDPVVLHDALPADYQSATAPLFLRLWQAQVPFNDGQPAKLDAVSGLEVTVTMDALPAANADGLPMLAARPFWHFAVRPGTPTSLYPARYLAAPQPPEGPRQWLTSLAVLAGGKLADCRVPYPKPDSAGCCGLTLGPAEVAALGGLQAVVDGLPGATVLSLRTGLYTLAAPLRLTAAHAGLSLIGCTDAVILAAAPSSLAAFAQGLVVLQGASRVTLRQLVLRVPEVPGATAGIGATSVGLRIDAAEQVRIEQCQFLATATGTYPLGVLLAVLGASTGTILRDNLFAASGGKDPIFYGVLATASAGRKTAMDQWQITGNRFTGLSLAVFAFAQLGLVNCSANIVKDCQGGLIFVDADITAASAFADYATKQAASGTQTQLGNAAYAALHPALLVNTVNQVAPLFASLAPAPSPLSAVADKALVQAAGSNGQAAYAAMLSPEDKAALAPAVKVDASLFDQLTALSVPAELVEADITPALRLDANEITLSGQAGAPGMAVVMSFQELGSVMVTGNRVVVPEASQAACSLLGPVAAVVSGNMFWQAGPPEGATGPFSLILLAGSNGIVSAGNVVVFAEFIAPARPAPAGTGTWDFLNSVTV